MTDSDNFGKPNPEGFQLLLTESFVEHKGMVFCKRSFDKKKIERLIEEEAPEQIQRWLNHTHMFFYAADIEIQRQWAQEVEKTWAESLRRGLPHLEIIFDRDDNGSEVIVTFWAKSQAPDVQGTR